MTANRHILKWELEVRQLERVPFCTINSCGVDILGYPRPVNRGFSSGKVP